MMQQSQDESLTRTDYKQFNINPNICQTYSLGILLLSLSTRTHAINFYTQNLSLNSSYLKERLYGLQKTNEYSKLLTNLIGICL
jgi:hypothetical protein